MVDYTPRHLPRPTPETLHFWDGTRSGELRLQKCDDCGGRLAVPSNGRCVKIYSINSDI